MNIFLIATGNDLVLVDSGMPGDEKVILETITGLGKQPGDLKGILVTHLHRDHAGSLAALKRASNVAVYMHAEDAAMVRQGIASRQLEAAPGRLSRLIGGLISRGEEPAQVEPVEVDHEISDGEYLPLAGGIRAVYLPGHTAGHMAFLWEKHGGVLFAGDAISGLFGKMRYSPIYEDLERGKESIRKIAGLNFEVLCLSHGKSIVGGADKAFRQKWNL